MCCFCAPYSERDDRDAGALMRGLSEKLVECGHKIARGALSEVDRGHLQAQISELCTDFASAYKHWKMREALCDALASQVVRRVDEIRSDEMELFVSEEDERALFGDAQGGVK